MYKPWELAFVHFALRWTRALAIQALAFIRETSLLNRVSQIKSSLFIRMHYWLKHSNWVEKGGKINDQFVSNCLILVRKFHFIECIFKPATVTQNFKNVLSTNVYALIKSKFNFLSYLTHCVIIQIQLTPIKPLLSTLLTLVRLVWYGSPNEANEANEANESPLEWMIESIQLLSFVTYTN